MDTPDFRVFPATAASPVAPGALSLPPGMATALTQRTPNRPVSRNAAIAIAVVALHVGFVWALQSGLLMRAVELIVPAEILTEFVTPPAPKTEPFRPAPQVAAKKPAEKVAEKAPVKTTAPTKTPAPQPLAVPDTAPAAAAPAVAATPAPSSAVMAAAPAAAVATGPAGPPSVQMPSSDADYLQNPQPPYPALSRRMNEQGKSVIKVLIGADGLPKKAEIARSSGFDRLDQTALSTVMRWRFVPGKRNGVPEAMWFNVPINWELRN